MGDQIIDGFTTALRNVTVSRKRALQILGGVIAVAAPSRIPQSAEARKRRKPPLAFVGATVTIDAASPTSFTWQISGALAHPNSNYATTFLSNRGVAANFTTHKVRADIVAHLKNFAASDIEQKQGQIVPRDRIAVVLL